VAGGVKLDVAQAAVLLSNDKGDDDCPIVEMAGSGLLVTVSSGAGDGGSEALLQVWFFYRDACLPAGKFFSLSVE
jgi:hypothetical protein